MRLDLDAAQSLGSNLQRFLVACVASTTTLVLLMWRARLRTAGRIDIVDAMRAVIIVSTLALTLSLPVALIAAVYLLQFLIFPLIALLVVCVICLQTLASHPARTSLAYSISVCSFGCFVAWAYRGGAHVESFLDGGRDLPGLERTGQVLMMFGATLTLVVALAQARRFVQRDRRGDSLKSRIG
jgi:hypothetical protein